jgi:poly(3-hydroxyalkanoate) synthetase
VVFFTRQGGKIGSIANKLHRSRQEQQSAKLSWLLQATFSIRFHILDLNLRKSVVRNLLASGGLDIYVLD